MAIVDLRGREDEPVVNALLTFAHASPESLERARANYHGREWMLVGWEDDGQLVACAGLERNGSDVVVRSLAVVPHRRRTDIGRSLIDALAGVAKADKLVAETDEDAVGFYRACGFSVEEIETKEQRTRFRVTRELESRPAAPGTTRAVTLADLEHAIRKAWGPDTSDDPAEWSQDNPARGQCAVTALLIRALVGGEIPLANVLREGKRVDRHAWNRLPTGLSLDLTRSQFRGGEEFDEPAPAEPTLTDRARYELLARRVRTYLSLSESIVF